MQINKQFLYYIKFLRQLKQKRRNQTETEYDQKRVQKCDNRDLPLVSTHEQSESEYCYCGSKECMSVKYNYIETTCDIFHNYRYCKSNRMEKNVSMVPLVIKTLSCLPTFTERALQYSTINQ